MGADQQRPKQSGPAVPAAVEDFIARWLGREGGQERANYSMFLTELCSALAIQPPDPAGDPETNDYVFERVVREPGRDGGVSSRRIDLPHSAMSAVRKYRSFVDGSPNGSYRPFAVWGGRVRR